MTYAWKKKKKKRVKPEVCRWINGQHIMKIVINITTSYLCLYSLLLIAYS
jgi:hypothetical protein